MPYVDEGENKIATLERRYKQRLLQALENRGYDHEMLEAADEVLDDAQNLSEEEIDGLRGNKEGHAIADTIIKIRRLHHLTRPASAGGWRKTSRIALAFCLTVGGWFLAPGSTNFLGGIAGSAIGLAAALVVGYFALGGRPERRHAIAALTSPTVSHRWRLIGAKVGPSLATISLSQLEADTPASHAS